MSNFKIEDIFSFIARYQQNGRDWQSDADTNRDGTIIKAEFTNWIKTAWKNENSQALDNDIINRFWNTFDNNKSQNKIEGTDLKDLNALNAAELDELNKQLEAQMEIEKKRDVIRKNPEVQAVMAKYYQFSGQMNRQREVLIQSIDNILNLDNATLNMIASDIAHDLDAFGASLLEQANKNNYTDNDNDVNNDNNVGNSNSTNNVDNMGNLKSWDSGTAGKSFYVGVSTTITPKAVLKDESDSSITYEIASTDNCTATAEGTNITIKPTYSGTVSVVVNIISNDEIVARKTITVIAANPSASEYVNSQSVSFDGVKPSDDDKNLKIYGCHGIQNGTAICDEDFKDLYNQNAVIELYSSDNTDGDWNEFKKASTVQTRLKNLLYLITSALANSGLDKAKLNTASQKVFEQFGNTNNWEPHKDRFKGGRSEYCSNKIQSGEYSNDTVVKQHDDIGGWHGDKIVYMVSFRGLVDAIFREYNKL